MKTQKQSSLLVVKVLIICFGILGFSNIVFSQEDVKDDFVPSGNIHLKIFTNYNYDFTPSEDNSSSFNLERAYFGYKYNFSEKFSTKFTLDFGRTTYLKDDKGTGISLAEGSAYSAYLKHAYAEWKVFRMVTIDFGLISFHQFDTQEKFWGHRYVYKSMMDEHKFGPSADLGMKVTFKPHEMVEIHASSTNGEGYKYLQDEFGLHNLAADVVFTPVEGLIIKAYYDLDSKINQLKKTDGTDSMQVWAADQSTLAVFAGYEKKDKFKVGVEFNSQPNHMNEDGEDLSGISAYGSYNINEHFEIFLRFDELYSTKVNPSDINPWNFANDGKLMMAGVQYKPVEGIKMSLNYQGWQFDDPDQETQPKVFLNLEYKIN